MSKRILLPSFLLFLFLLGSTAASQSLTINFYTSSDYRRSALFAAQDRIYDREVQYSQGLELICRQDKVKAEIQGLGTYYTPLDLNDIPPGDYRIQLSKTGFYPYQFTVTIKSNARSSVEVDLKPYLTSLNIDGLPSRSVIYINNNKIEGHKADVTPGDVSLRIKTFGYEDYFQVITVDAQEEQSFSPVLVPRDFSLSAIEVNRNTIWLGDSPSQKIVRFTVSATAPGTASYRIIRESDNSVVQEEILDIETEKTEIIFDLRKSGPAEAGVYHLEIKGEGLEDKDLQRITLMVSEGGKSRWRNSFSGTAGFLYCPEARTLPQGVSQIQTGFNPAFTGRSLDDLYIPAFLSLRTGITDRIEVTAGTTLFLSPQTEHSSFDFQASGKFMILGHDKNKGFALSASLSANYNGIAGNYGSVPPFDPYGGVTGLSLSLPVSFGIGLFSVVIAPEFRFSPSYPMTEPGGFQEGELYIWNYFKGAMSIDVGSFSAAFSMALQTPSYLHGGNEWPLYLGLESSLTPGSTGFTISLFGGLRYLSGDDLLGTAGLSAGFIW
ncbi:PEGA domain-containing protein [Spirochaeta isovalerica]|uniref:PEGA domain-containing protein n=1 Tax=Spirochaeta isovalerica TaxID=150 RepID=A0A841R2B8_9SPIO|nr:PEGA domain-containing protein [Spirochaeta isovalerica]MBB6479164.1 hypothetical protein [Spirochaeta isovalerica]